MNQKEYEASHDLLHGIRGTKQNYKTKVNVADF
jgi:hypothetical protein